MQLFPLELNQGKPLAFFGPQFLLLDDKDITQSHILECPKTLQRVCFNGTLDGLHNTQHKHQQQL